MFLPPTPNPSTLTPPPPPPPAPAALPDHRMLSALRCPIMDELMAEPVLAADGFTYERANLERAWSAAAERAAERLQAERPADDDACCGAEQAFVRLSPMTNQPITAALTPNHVIVQLIEGAIEAGSIPADEAAEWRQRRTAATSAAAVATHLRSEAAVLTSAQPAPAAQPATPSPALGPAAEVGVRATECRERRRPSAAQQQQRSALAVLERERSRLLESVTAPQRRVCARVHATRAAEQETAFVELSRVEAEIERLQLELTVALSVDHADDPEPRLPATDRGGQRPPGSVPGSVRRSLTFGLQRTRQAAARTRALANGPLHQTWALANAPLRWASAASARAQEREERAQAERQEAQVRRRTEEQATADFLRRVDPFTGEAVQPGDLRMCGRCHAGPWRKRGCNDMRRHNRLHCLRPDESGTHNRCRNCFWFEADWTRWPEWDGVMGPHSTTLQRM